MTDGFHKVDTFTTYLVAKQWFLLTFEWGSVLCNLGTYVIYVKRQEDSN